MRPSDISRLVTVRDPRLSPDGRTVAFVVERADGPASCYRSAIWLAAVDGSTPPTQLSAGAERDSEPAWSPDRRRLAFSRSPAIAGSGGDDTRHQLLVVPVDGPGEVVTVAADEYEAFVQVAWSPDGQQLVYAQRVRDRRYEPEADRLRPPRRIERLFNRLDSVGWTVDRPTHVFVVPVDGTAPPRQLTDGAFEHGEPAWSPDGRRLVCVAARHEDWDIDPAVDLWALDPAGGEPRRLTGTDLAWRAPSWSPDGSRIAALVSDERTAYRHHQVAVLDPTSGSSTVLTAELDRQCAPYFSAQPPVWVGGEVLFGIEDRGRLPLLRVAVDGGGAAEPVLGGDRWITGYDATPDGSTIAFCATSATEPPELSVRSLAGGERKLTSFQRGFLGGCPPQPAERFTVPSPAGDGGVDAWMLRPPGFQPDRRYPLLLQVHGGPMTQHGERWFDEAQIYAAAGYVVVLSNPHGSTGFTEGWVRAIRSPQAKDDPGTGWGGVDFDDLMAVVDAALAREPGIDPERLGILGGSYGGYMASWVVSHTDRFAAACSERSANNLHAEELASDLGAAFRRLFGLDPVRDADEYRRMSPVSYVADIHTPLLILHSEDDLRCPIGQADELFTLLRLLGREVEYWRFPAESHEMSRSGSPAHRQQRAEIILDWFARFL